MNLKSLSRKPIEQYLGKEMTFEFTAFNEDITKIRRLDTKFTDFLSISKHNKVGCWSFRIADSNLRVSLIENQLTFRKQFISAKKAESKQLIDKLNSKVIVGDLKDAFNELDFTINVGHTLVNIL